MISHQQKRKIVGMRPHDGERVGCRRQVSAQTRCYRIGRPSSDNIGMHPDEAPVIGMHWELGPVFRMHWEIGGEIAQRPDKEGISSSSSDSYGYVQRKGGG